MGAFIFIIILFGFFYCIIPILLIFEIYHWITKQNRVKYPLLMGTICGLIIGLVVAYINLGGSGESGMIGNGIAIIVFPTSLVLGIIIGLFYGSFNRTIFLKKNNRTTSKST
jgi:hypothetical protein